MFFGPSPNITKHTHFVNDSYSVVPTLWLLLLIQSKFSLSSVEVVSGLNTYVSQVSNSGPWARFGPHCNIQVMTRAAGLQLLYSRCSTDTTNPRMLCLYQSAQGVPSLKNIVMNLLVCFSFLNELWAGGKRLHLKCKSKGCYYKEPYKFVFIFELFFFFFTWFSMCVILSVYCIIVSFAWSLFGLKQNELGAIFKRTTLLFFLEEGLFNQYDHCLTTLSKFSVLFPLGVWVWQPWSEVPKGAQCVIGLNVNEFYW